MDLQFVVTLLVTIVITGLLVSGWNWILRSRNKYPELYRQRGVIRAIVLLILHTGDLS